MGFEERIRVFQVSGGPLGRSSIGKNWSPYDSPCPSPEPEDSK